MQIHHYSHATTPAGPGTDTVISGAVQVDPAHKFSAAAALGDTAIVGINVDDDAAAYDFQGLWRWYVIEDACNSSDHYAFNGYIGQQGISRGSGTLLAVGTARRWDLTLYELNKLAAFRVISGDDGNRPAETVAARIAWLISTVYLPVNDHGLIQSNTTALDANDYRGQKASDVLNDMANFVGWNWWIWYHQASGDDSLAFMDPASSSYTASISISNVAADVDNATVFAPQEDWIVERDPDKIAAGVYEPYTGGALYEYDYTTSYAFAFQDQVAPTASVKTLAKATALADRFLADNNEQDEKMTCTLRLPASQLNDVKHGHLITVTLQNVPGWTTGKQCRVTRKTFGYPENRTQAFYDVELELSAVTVAGTSGATDVQRIGVSYSGQPTLINPTTPGRVLLMAVVGIGGVTLFPNDIRMKNDPSVSPATPEVPPFPDHDGWTVLGTAVTDSSGMNIGGPCGGFSTTPYCTAGFIVGWAWRYVLAGEQTKVPVAVSTDLNNARTAAWVWELPSSAVPSFVATLGSTHVAGNPTHWDFGAYANQNLVGLFAFAQQDYGNPPYQVTPDTNVTTVQSAAQSNNPALSPTLADDGSLHGWWIPWTYIGQMSAGGTLGVTIETISAYTSLNGCGVLIALPPGVTLPAIPYPANQV